MHRPILTHERIQYLIEGMEPLIPTFVHESLSASACHTLRSFSLRLQKKTSKIKQKNQQKPPIMRQVKRKMPNI